MIVASSDCIIRFTHYLLNLFSVSVNADVITLRKRNTMQFKLIICSAISAMIFAGCSGPVAQSQSDPSVPLHLIDYAHSAGGNLIHGTISDFDGGVKATWTTNAGSTNVDMSMEELFELWQSLTSSEVFTESVVTDENAELDPEKFHVITVVEKYNGNTKKQLHLIPADSKSPVLQEWIGKLKIPQ